MNAEAHEGPSDGLQQLAKDLGFTVPPPRPDEEAPPVDVEVLHQFRRGELSERVTERVHELIAMYRPWARAYGILCARGVEEK
jgi:hypothetical protein